MDEAYRSEIPVLATPQECAKVYGDWEEALSNAPQNPVTELIKEEMWGVERGLKYQTSKLSAKTQKINEKYKSETEYFVKQEELEQMKSCIGLLSSMKQGRYESTYDYALMKRNEYSEQVQQLNNKWADIVTKGQNKGYSVEQLTDTSSPGRIDRINEINLWVGEVAIKLKENARKLSLANEAVNYAKGRRK